jgi:hypothetical protein
MSKPTPIVLTSFGVGLGLFGLYIFGIGPFQYKLVLADFYMLDCIQRLSLRHCKTSKFKLTQKREPLGRNLRLCNAQEPEEGPRYIRVRVSLMPDRTRKRPNKANALARWDNEGGAAKGAPQKDRDDLTSLTKEEEHILRCLGALVITQWNDLPTDIQHKLF